MAELTPSRFDDQNAARSFREYLLIQRGSDRELAAILRDAADESARLARTIPDTGVGSRVRRAQLEQVAAALYQSQIRMWANVGAAIAKRIKAASDVAMAANRRMNRFAARAATPELRSSFLAAAESSALNVQSRLLNNIGFSERVYKNRELAAGRVAQIANRGIAMNKSAKEIADDVRKFIRPDTRGGVSYAAMRLGRTELNNAFHRTSARVYEAQPWVAGVKWHLSRSHPRPDECDSYAGDDHAGLGSGVFPRGDVPGKPHPQCLCFVIPILEEEDEFLDKLVGGQYNDFLATIGYGGL